MAPWKQFEAEAPELFATVEQMWPGIVALDRDEGGTPPSGPVFAISYLATVRPDGGPRLHPFCPILAGGRLFAAVPPSSPKGRDLRRDPRCVIHALPGPADDELCIRARAREVDDDDTRTLVQRVVGRSGIGGMIEGVAHHPLFELDIERVDVASWVDVGQPGTHAVRRQWRAPASRSLGP